MEDRDTMPHWFCNRAKALEFRPRDASDKEHTEGRVDRMKEIR